MSLGRDAGTPFTPTPGALGLVEIGGVFLNMNKISADEGGELLGVTNFNSPKRLTNKGAKVIQNEFIHATETGEYVIEGDIDRSLIGWRPRYGDRGACILWFGQDPDQAIGFEFVVERVLSTQEAMRKGELSIRVKADGAVSLTGWQPIVTS